MRKSVVTVAVLGLLGAAIYFIPYGTPYANSSDTFRQLKLFGDVFERVRAEYVEDVTDEQLIEFAIEGMLTALDPHSGYLDAKKYRDMQVQTRGEFGGLGIEVTMENGLVKVVSPIDDTPAERAGIQAGDVITHINAEPVLGLSLAEAVERMRGPVDTEIDLTLRRDGNEDDIDVTMVRETIEISPVRHRVEGDIGYIRVTTFNERTDTKVREAVEDLREEQKNGLGGIILDLRNNPGGLLEQAVAVADSFMEQGEIVSTRGRRSDAIQRFNADRGDITGGLPMVVLINGGSASASEIVAGALQDHERAIIMGTDSFGKGSVQTIMPLPGHGAIRLTTARYYTPSGSSIQARGIVPDIEVRQSRIEVIEGSAQRREADLRNRLDNENDQGPTSEGAEGEVEKEMEAVPPAGAQDYQLERALDLLRGLAMFGTGSSKG